MADAGQDHEPRRGDRRVQRLADGNRGAHVLIAVEQQRRHLDPGQDVAQIRRGERARQRAEPDGMELGHARREGVGGRLRHPGREHRRAHRGHELLRRPVREVQHLAQAPLGLLGRERAGPAGVRRGEDQRSRHRGMAAVELEREPAAEGQPGHVRPLEPERGHEAGEAVREVAERERLGRIRRLAGAGRVPGHDRELVRQRVELVLPRRTAVADVAVQEHERRPVARPLEGDPQPVDLDEIPALRHRRQRTPGGRPAGRAKPRRLPRVLCAGGGDA